jgi:glycosyltransferase involved in cell wall biosynthesis
MKIVAIIPAFNEEKRIGATLLALKSYVQEMVVIDDGSLDGTVQVALDSGAHVLKHLVNRGQGASLQTGTEYALRVLEADAIVHFDADGQMDPSEIPTLLAPIASGEVDIVIGSRFLGEAVNIPPMRKFFLKLATWFTAVISGIPVTDTHNGFRVLSRKAAKEIRSHCCQKSSLS